MMTNKQIIERIKKAQNIAIFAHIDPDPDALGSMFGMREFCHQLGKKADVFVAEIKETFMRYIFPLQESKQEFVPEQYDLVIVTDLHILGRLNPQFQQNIKDFSNIIVIDHHIVMGNDELFTKNMRVLDVAAASMLVVDLYKACEMKPNKNAATYLYAGLMGDTDRFLHNNLSKLVFDDAVYLMEAGARVQEVYDYMFRYTTPEEIRVHKMLYNNLVYLENGRVAYVIFTLKDLKRLNADIEDVKAFSSTLIRIKGVELAFLIYEKERKQFKFSIRSSKANIVPSASKMGGGGHPCAAGFDFYGTKYKIKRILPELSREILNG